MIRAARPEEAPLLAALVERTAWPLGFAAAGAAALAATVLLGPLVRAEVPLRGPGGVRAAP